MTKIHGEAIKKTMSYKKKVQILSKRVEKGIRFLDKTKKGRSNWLNKIDLTILDLGNSSTCMCGQVFQDYMIAQDKFFEDESNIAAMYGFNTFSEDTGWEEEHECDLEDAEGTMDILTHVWYCKVHALKQQ